MRTAEQPIYKNLWAAVYAKYLELIALYDIVSRSHEFYLS